MSAQLKNLQFGGGRESAGVGPHASHFSSGLLIVFLLCDCAGRPGVSSGPLAALAEVLGC